MPVTQFLFKINKFILNPVIVLGFVVASVILFYGIVQLIRSDSDDSREKSKDAVLYGVIGLFVMFSVYGIIGFVLKTFGLNYPSFLP